MDKKAYLFLIIVIVLINTIYAKDLEIADKVLSDIQEDAFDFYKYQDVFYPPEEELAKQGTTLESYKQSLKQSAPKNRNSTVANIWGTCPTTGTVHIPVLLVQFTDKFPMYTLEDINYYFNSPVIESNFISVSKYYNMQSYGALNLVFDVKPWTTMPRSFSYYSATADTEFQLVIDAYTTFNLDVNFAEYDNDNDGRIDGAVLIYPDIGINGVSGIWPQTRILKEHDDNSVDGKYLGNAALVSERKSTGHNYFATVVATHEFAHVLGLMDFYTSSNKGAIYQMSMMIFKEYSGSTNYCLNKPINLDVWSRYFLGWIEPEILTTESYQNISLRSVNDYPDAVILRNNNFGTREFFIIENRHRSLTDLNNLDRCMFNNSNYNTGGFAIYHVDEQYIENNYANNNIMYDPDGICGSNSHPGISNEQNVVTSCSSTDSSLAATKEDLYFDGELSGCNQFSRFDENAHNCTSDDLLPELDFISNSYIGINTTFVRFQALSPASQYTMIAKMLVGEETVIPTAYPDSGTHPENTQITLSTTTPQSTIYYTTDGTNPTTNSTVYSGSILLPVGPVTLKAIARRNGYYVSDIMSNMYTITGTVANVIAIPGSGSVNSGTEVVLSSPTDGATIRYTLDNSEPDENSNIYSEPIIITQDINLTARAFKDNWQPSLIVVFNYTVNRAAIPTASPISGTAVDYNSTVSLSSPTADATIKYTLDNSEPNENSNIYSTPITITGTTTIKAKTFKQGHLPSETVDFNYTLASVATPVASHTGGEILFRTPVTLSTITPGAIIRYTINGTEPTGTSPRYLFPIYIVQPITLKVKAFKDGQQSSEIAVYNYQVKLTEPIVNISSGNYPFTTKIKLISDIPGAQIYYTTDGTDPNNGQLYTTHLRLLEDTHLRAIAKRTGYEDSEILNKNYVVSNQEQQVPKLLIDPRIKAYENFDVTYITERHWTEEVNFTITNINGCTFNLRPLIYNDGHYTYYIFENNRCIRRQRTRLTLMARDQNGEERADAELLILDSGLQAVSVGMN